MELAAPLDGLGYVPLLCYCSVGGVGVGGADVGVWIVDLTDVLGDRYLIAIYSA